MNGLSPRPFILTPKQVQISTEISEAVQEFPAAISDLISQYSTPDFALATVEPELNQEGEVIQNETNQRTLAMIELALTTPSSECAPWIKANIFINASEVEESRYVIKPYLVKIINQLTQNGVQINLDNVYLKELSLSGKGSRAIDLSGMSARGATFVNIKVDMTNLALVDFTGAQFYNTEFFCAELNKADFTDAKFENVTFSATMASGLTGNQSRILQCSRTYPVTRTMDTFEIFLNLNDQSASPDTDSYTLQPEKFPWANLKPLGT